jgi:hypothetical protein
MILRVLNNHLGEPILARQILEEILFTPEGQIYFTYRRVKLHVIVKAIAYLRRKRGFDIRSYRQGKSEATYELIPWEEISYKVVTHPLEGTQVWVNVADLPGTVYQLSCWDLNGMLVFERQSQPPTTFREFAKRERINLSLTAPCKEGHIYIVYDGLKGREMYGIFVPAGIPTGPVIRELEEGWSSPITLSDTPVFTA